MKKFFRFLFLAILVLFVLVQFYPKPAKNEGPLMSANDISNKYPVPPGIDSILKTSCYDCHSNHTVYPWYSRVQPVAWWLGGHIDEGKREINFNEFLSYKAARQYKKMADIREQVENNEMPLTSYTLIHTYAKLSEAQKTSLINWSEDVRTAIKGKYPADSLTMPKRPQ